MSKIIRTEADFLSFKESLEAPYREDAMKLKGDADNIKEDIARRKSARESRTKLRILKISDEAVLTLSSELPSDSLFCPICGDENRHNSLGGVPWCFKCKHRLIRPEEKKTFNRKYRRGLKQRANI